MYTTIDTRSARARARFHKNKKRWRARACAGVHRAHDRAFLCCLLLFISHITHHTAHTAQPTSHPEHHHCPRPRRPPLPHSSQSAGHAALMALSISTTDCFLACLLTIFVCLGHDELEGELLLLGLDDEVSAGARSATFVDHAEFLRVSTAPIKRAWYDASIDRSME